MADSKNQDSNEMSEMLKMLSVVQKNSEIACDALVELSVKYEAMQSKIDEIATESDEDLEEYEPKSYKRSSKNGGRKKALKRRSRYADEDEWKWKDLAPLALPITALGMTIFRKASEPDQSQQEVVKAITILNQRLSQLELMSKQNQAGSGMPQ